MLCQHGGHPVTLPVVNMSGVAGASCHCLCDPFGSVAVQSFWGMYFQKPGFQIIFRGVCAPLLGARVLSGLTSGIPLCGHSLLGALALTTLAETAGV